MFVVALAEGAVELQSDRSDVGHEPRRLEGRLFAHFGDEAEHALVEVRAEHACHPRDCFHRWLLPTRGGARVLVAEVIALVSVAIWRMAKYCIWLNICMYTNINIMR